MATSKPITVLDDILKRQERRAEIVRKMREMLADDPAFVQELISEMGAQAGSRNGHREAGAGTQAAAIAEHFKKNENAWMTSPELMKTLGLKRFQVSTVLYRSKLFESRDHPESPKLKQWRLKAAAKE